MVEEEKIPVNFSPDLVVIVVCRPVKLANRKTRRS
jgi:hypothetical protein